MLENRRTSQRSEEELGREGNGNYMTQIHLTLTFSVSGNQWKLVIEPINSIVSYVATIPLVCSNEYEMLKTLGLVSLPLSSDSVKPNI